MRIKNYQEDLVIHLVEITLEDYPEIEADEIFIHDVTAYALNRIPPKYIMTERGFTRFASSNLTSTGNGDGLANLVELLIVIKKGISVVQHRRTMPQAIITESIELEASKFGAIEDEAQVISSLLETEKIVYVHNFPQFIGRVVNKSTLIPIMNACVTLFINGETVVPAEPGWINPYYTNEPTKGYFSFWPRAQKTESEIETFKFTIEVTHQDFDPARIECPVNSTGLYVIHDYIEGDAVLELDTIYIEANPTND